MCAGYLVRRYPLGQMGSTHDYCQGVWGLTKPCHNNVILFWAKQYYQPLLIKMRHNHNHLNQGSFRNVFHVETLARRMCCSFLEVADWILFFRTHTLVYLSDNLLLLLHSWRIVCIITTYRSKYLDSSVKLWPRLSADVFVKLKLWI